MRPRCRNTLFLLASSVPVPVGVSAAHSPMAQPFARGRSPGGTLEIDESWG